MKHLIFGTGLIGTYLGASLIEGGHDTTFLSRDHQRKVLESGLRASDLEGNEASIAAPKFIDPTCQQPFDVIWLTVKCTAVAKSLDQVGQFLDEDSLIVCCQNGFGSDIHIRNAYPNTQVINAVVGYNVAQEQDNHYHRSTDGSLVVESHEKLNEIIASINSPLFPSHVSHDIEADRWAKLQLNLANPVNALADIPTKAMAEDADFRKVIVALMRELLAVTDKLELSLPKLTALPAKLLPKVMSLPNWIYLILAQKTLAIDPTARVSMWWDLSQGKQSEINYLNQAIVEKGKQLGIACPFNQRIVELIHDVEQNHRQIGVTGKELQSLLGIN